MPKGCSTSVLLCPAMSVGVMFPPGFLGAGADLPFLLSSNSSPLGVLSTKAAVVT